jgi:hypothetical protein
METLSLFKKNIFEYGRPLEKYLYLYHFENGEVDDIINELKTFQNSDGGFGHGLEPDFINPNSSPIQTWTAITIFRQIKIAQDHPMLLRMFDYLASSYDKEMKRWANTIPSNDDYPHAPWWTYRKDDSFNPSISLASYIMTHAHPSHPAYSYAKEVVYDAILYLETKKDQIEVHELRCFIDMANDLITLGGDMMLSDRLKTILLTQMIGVITPDVSIWFSTYAAKPSSIIKSYPSFGSEELKNILISEMHLALQHRDEKGAWDITFAWTEYLDEFEKSKRTWRAIFCLEYAIMMTKLGIIQ